MYASRWIRVWFVSAFGTLGACGAPPTGACAPGTVEVCTCPGGAGGTQTCNAAGTALGACTCGGGGCGATGCNPGFRCDVRGTCSPDPSAFWQINAARGSVAERDCAGASWDPVGGLPDPKVCLTINGTRTCTQAVPDTTSPVWNANFPAATASMLQGGIQFELLDEDLTSDDTICSGTLAITDTDLATGRAASIALVRVARHRMLQSSSR